MKKIAVIIGMCCSALSINSHAEASPTNDVVRALIQKEGFALEKGVILRPTIKIMAPNNLNSLWVSTPNTHQSQSSYQDRIEELVQLDDAVQTHYNANVNNHDRNSAVLRKNIADIHLAYSFTPVPDADISKPYGFAACGTFNNGWTGVTEFFQTQNVGNCAFTDYNFALAHAVANATDAVVRYDVNNKATTVHVEGNNDTGFLYTVAWMDSTYFRTLECATKHNTENVTAQVIALAQRIDNP
ncbi:MAG TPA: hypothetical protein DDY37_07340 [Legionella sp.]|nr:hypothetical protein [Legionella sp.]